MTTAHAVTVDVDFYPSPAVRRTLLRQLAEHLEDFTPADVHRAVAVWTPGLTAATRLEAWDELVLGVNRLADLGAGLEWRDVAPGAPPSSGYTIAAEVLEQDITTALQVLVPAVTG